ncbi:hypothetical protein CQ13_28645 [Bradyrhizobium retamae]|uniref:HTH araC/xylS-type domain-containing protein n=2 Tax=Bradyrhizobium retamae TaxID=1300035 RepID=A0A0R3MQZ8_9BRAD|nr:hypothetical protein CQ13_28645 [Bradyrhizobium retamae]
MPSNIVTQEDRYLIGLALRSTQVRLIQAGRTIFDGKIPVGALHIAKPPVRSTAHFQSAYDFIYFHIAPSFLDQQPMSPHGYFAHSEPVDRILLRDPLAEQLAKVLSDRVDDEDLAFSLCVGQTLAAHVVRLAPPHSKTNALPKWRLRLVEDYIDRHLHWSIGLADLAKAAGLSRMHFAALFRAATGYRPREYLLQKRVERAKALLGNSDMPLAEIALAVGFSTQAHFSTVFKRMAASTPARWRADYRSETASPLTVLERDRYDIDEHRTEHSEHPRKSPTLGRPDYCSDRFMSAVRS